MKKLKVITTEENIIVRISDKLLLGMTFPQAKALGQMLLDGVGKHPRGEADDEPLEQEAIVTVNGMTTDEMQ